jgi:hypothetical protein
VDGLIYVGLLTNFLFVFRFMRDGWLVLGGSWNDVFVIFVMNSNRLMF